MVEIKLTSQIVVNAAFGGFSLSRAAAEEVFRRKGISINSNEWIGDTVDEHVARNDPILIAVVREMGEAANGESAKLEIRDVTAVVEVISYDGKESIHVYHVKN